MLMCCIEGVSVEELKELKSYTGKLKYPHLSLWDRAVMQQSMSGGRTDEWSFMNHRGSDNKTVNLTTQNITEHGIMEIAEIGQQSTVDGQTAKLGRPKRWAAGNRTRGFLLKLEVLFH